MNIGGIGSSHLKHSCQQSGIQRCSSAGQSSQSAGSCWPRTTPADEPCSVVRMRDGVGQLSTWGMLERETDGDIHHGIVVRAVELWERRVGRVGQVQVGQVVPGPGPGHAVAHAQQTDSGCEDAKPHL